MGIFKERTLKMTVLNLAAGNGNYLRYTSTIDQWFINKTEIALKAFYLDHGSVKTGWGYINEGMAPDWQWDTLLGVPLAQPTKEHRRGFSARVWIPGYSWVDWATNSTGSNMGFDSVFELVWGHKDSHPGEFAEIQYTGSQPLRIGKGNTRKPLFQVLGWVPQASILTEVKVVPAVMFPNATTIAQPLIGMQPSVALPFNP
jgi:hypothetical protein